MTPVQKSLLISVALHIFVFLGFWVTPKKPDSPVSYPSPITVDLINTPGPSTEGVGTPSKKSSRSIPKSQRGPKKLSLSDLAPKWDIPISKEGSMNSSNSPNDNSQDSFGGGGGMDVLNRPELVYASYYQRIHDKLEYYWQSKIKYEVLKKQAAGEWKYYLNKRTRTRVILDSQGNLKRVVILSPSGEQELDSSALSAFQQASPFPNPPRDLIKDGEVSILWDFILEIH